MARPIIGITTYGRDEDNRYRLPCAYVDCVRRAGGIAILIPPGDDGWQELSQVLDGVIVAGGGDIDPSLYGGRMHEALYAVDPERDQSELAIAKSLVASDLPTLAICRGHQLINVALGGTLHEHLPDVVGDRVLHRLPPREPTEHPITVHPNTRLGAVLGELEFSAASSHHQAINKLGKGLSVVAEAPDGTIEACDLAGHRWFFTVQWHPEMTAHSSGPQQRLFDALVAACRERASKREA